MPGRHTREEEDLTLGADFPSTSGLSGVPAASGGIVAVANCVASLGVLMRAGVGRSGALLARATQALTLSIVASLAGVGSIGEA
jgi:hypothetical protein